MDKRTRVLNALNKEEVDHVPVGFWFHFAGEEAVGDACVKAHLRYYMISAAAVMPWGKDMRNLKGVMGFLSTTV